MEGQVGGCFTQWLGLWATATRAGIQSPASPFSSAVTLDKFS